MQLANGPYSDDNSQCPRDNYTVLNSCTCSL